jgi:hypothetical protein
VKFFVVVDKLETEDFWSERVINREEKKQYMNMNLVW